MAKFEQTPKEEKLEIVPEAEAQFDYQAALNNKDFLNFLAEHKDAADLDLNDAANLEIIENRYRAYEQKEFLLANLPNFYKEELEPRFYVDVPKKDLEELKNFIEQEAVAHPAELEKYFDGLQNLFRYRKENAELEVQIKELGGKRGIEKEKQFFAEEKKSVEKKKGSVESAMKDLWFINPKNWELAQDLFKISDRNIRRETRSKTKQERLEFFKKLDEQAKLLDESEKFLGRFPAAKHDLETKMSATANLFFKRFQPAKNIFEAMSTKTAKVLDAMIGEADSLESIKEIEEMAQAYLNRVTAGVKEVGAAELEALPVDMFQKRIDEKLGSIVVENIKKEVGEFRVGNQPLDALRGKFKAYLDKEKLGSRSKATIRSLVAGCVGNEIERLLQEKPDGYTEKSLLLKMLLAEISFNA